MTNRKVTEQDFRQAEFRDKNPEDYEFRGDGKIVRKDRWKNGIISIASIVGLNVCDFEIDDVIEKVEAMSRDIEWPKTRVDTDE